jgi:outer membrane protein assembly factor BamB/plastocyanin
MAKKKRGGLSRLYGVFLIAGGVIALSFLLPGFSKIPNEVKMAKKEWPLPNRDYENTRATEDSSINSNNVASLGVAWYVPLTGASEWGAAATNPIVLNNIVYIQDLKSNVYAISLKDGSLLWKKEYNLDAYGPNGPALGWGKIFLLKGHTQVAALDLTGKELWSTTITESKTAGLDIQLTIYDGKVYVSTVPGTSNSNFYTGGEAGVIYALDQSNGKIVWGFETVDSKDIWGNPKVNSGGGAWYPPAVDTQTNRLFFGIGNPGPWPGTKEFPNGSSRPGPNLYTNSLVSLSATTGKLSWYSQVTPHDLFDYDFQIPPILATVDLKKIVIGAGKSGKVVGFDREGGAIIWTTKVGEHKNDELTGLSKGITRVLPGPLGGVETPMALAKGVVFVPYLNVFADYTPTGIEVKTFDLMKGTGGVAALSAATGELIWETKLPAINVGGATVVNDLVFTSTNDGMIYALFVGNGKILWSYRAPGGINSWPAVAGDTLLMPVGLGSAPMLMALRPGGNQLIPTASVEKEFGQTKTVRIKNFAFVPKVVNVEAGTKVVWINEDAAVHTINGPGFDSQSLARGESFEFVFDKPGVIDYLCGLHPSMLGTVRVR